MTRAQHEKMRETIHELRNQVRRMQRKADRGDRLEAAIREHHNQVVERENWGADDDLWAGLGLWRRPEHLRDERVAA